MKRLSDLEDNRSGRPRRKEAVSEAIIRHSLLPLFKAPGLNYSEHQSFDEVFSEQLRLIYEFPFDETVTIYDRLPILATFTNRRKLPQSFNILFEVLGTTCLVSDLDLTGSSQFFFVRAVEDKEEAQQQLVSWFSCLGNTGRVSNASSSVLARTIPREQEDEDYYLLAAQVSGFSNFRS